MRLRSRALRTAAGYLPAPVHPDPLFRVAEQHPLERNIVRFGVPPDRFANVFALDERQRIFKTEDMFAVRLAPTANRDNRGAGCQRKKGNALERARRVAKEINCHAVTPARVLVEHVNDDCPARKQVEDRIERTAFGQRAKTSPVKSARDKVVQNLRLERTTYKVQQAAVFRELTNSGHRCHFKIAEMPGQKEYAFALRQRADWRLYIFNLNPRFAPLR